MRLGNALKTCNAAFVSPKRRHDDADVVTALFVYYRFRKPTYTGEEKTSDDRTGAPAPHRWPMMCLPISARETAAGALYAVDLLREVSKPDQI